MAFKYNVASSIDRMPSEIISNEDKCELLDTVSGLVEAAAEIEALQGQADECEAVMENIQNTLDLLAGSYATEALEIVNLDRSISTLTGHVQPSVKVAQEGLGEALKKAWDTFVEFCKKVWEKITS